MIMICPTITAENTHTYREQIERVELFTNHVHLDVMDGVFTPNTSIALEKLWLPDGMTCDVHVMFAQPEQAIDRLLILSVRTVIVPAESDADFQSLATKLHDKSIQFGIALLHDTSIDTIANNLEYIDHVLLFSGNLGYQGGSTADLSILKKATDLKRMKPTLEIGWDGGVTDENCSAIVQAGVSVINSGSFIHFAKQPAEAYKKLVDSAHIS